MLQAGVVQELAPGLRRLVAPNAGAMTGSGTNTYLMGTKPCTVIDPGPADSAHVEAILAACEGRIEAIFVTHTHRDHSPGAAVLARETGAILYGAAPPDDVFQDQTFAADVELVDGMRYSAGGLTLLAVHTPGHVGNHYCLLLEEQGILMTGDHIMNGSTVVIIPPSGDMGHYLRSLDRLLAYPVRQLAPGHGDLMDDPQGVISGLIQHRLKREAKVIERLGTLGRCTLETLVRSVYDDVDSSLHPIARLSLWAHLIKLEQDGRAQSDEPFWSAA